MLPSSRSSSTFARHLSARLTSQRSAAYILVSRAALVASSSSHFGGSNSSRCSSQQQQRCQSSHALTTSTPATRGSSSSSNTNNNKDKDVKPWLRQYRPQVNGRAVAFHVSDLLKQSPVSPVSSSSNSNSAEFRPAQQRQYESDLVVILDMDECMIHSQFLSSPSNAQVYAHQLQRQRRNSGSNGNGSSEQVVDHFRVHLPSTGDLVHVNVRPGLRDFLQKVTARYETHVFTAAMSVYAKPVLEQLDPHGEMFAQVWFREHCRYDAQHNAYLKDLEALPPTCLTTNATIKLNRTVLIDNNPLSFITHPENGILVSSFYNDAQDNTLPAVFDLLQELESYPDVRPVLDRRFGLKTALLGQQQAQQAQQQKKTKATGMTATVPLANIVQQQQQQQQQVSLQQQQAVAF